MRCDEARERLSAWLDGELGADEARAVAAHAAGCKACADRLDDYRRLGRGLKSAGRAPLPPGLATAVSAALARERIGEGAATVPVPVSRPSSWSRWRPMLARAAALAGIAVLSGTIGWWAATSAAGQDRVEREVLNAHVRSLVQDSPVQVASSDQHTVKPWLAGRNDIAPAAKDLSTAGFALVGGRLDYVDGQRASVVVYRRRAHVINVFHWPAREVGEQSPRTTTRNGFTLVTFTRAGLTTWLASDLNAEEMRQLAGLL